MGLNISMVTAWLFFLASLTISRAETDCGVESKDCTCVMPKLYECPTVTLSLNPVPDGCPLLKDELAGPNFSNLTCGVNDTYNPLSNDGVIFRASGRWLEFANEACDNDFYFIVDLNGGQLVKTVMLEDINPDETAGIDVSFEFAYGYTVPCTDQPTINTLLWQYITPGRYDPGADINKVWNRLNFTDNIFEHHEADYFKAAYLFIHFSHVPINSRFRLTMTGCHENAKDIDPALEYLNNLEIKTEREMEHGGWKINEKKHVQRTFVRKDSQ